MATHPILDGRLEIVGRVLGFDGFFDLHIAEFIGVKDLATILALDKLTVFVTGDDADFRVFAGACHFSGKRLNLELFPPDCSLKFDKVQRVIAEFSP
jgi:hypothetical protein